MEGQEERVQALERNLSEERRDKEEKMKEMAESYQEEREVRMDR